MNPNEFTKLKKDGLYEAIFKRRDVRRDFLPDDVPQDVLARILKAGHHAPSVGYSQPWNFTLVKSQEKRQQIKEAFTRANQKATTLFSGEKKELYKKIKLEGIMESPLNICVTCDTHRNGPVTLGTTSQDRMELYSTVCCIQNMWLAARTEGVGMGWVSIIDPDELKNILNIPKQIDLIAYLCLGYVSDFGEKPDLEKVGWQQRARLKNLIFEENFNQKVGDDWSDLVKAIQNTSFS